MQWLLPPVLPLHWLTSIREKMSQSQPSNYRQQHQTIDTHCHRELPFISIPHPFCRWKKIGKIVDLNFFPVKSCAPIKEDAFECHQLGIADGEFFDRCFIVSGNDKQITARIYPKMVLIRPKVVGNQLILSAPGKDDFVIDLDELKNKTITAKVACWYSTVKGIDVGDDAAEWLSEFIAGKSQALRLLYYPYLHPTKGKAAKDKIYKQFSANDAGTYHDSTSYMMINQASIDEINTHLDHVVKPLQFRPNFVVKGPGAYAEDTWKWVRIGPNVVFRVLKPCTR